jgi:hypothetical protein
VDTIEPRFRSAPVDALIAIDTGITMLMAENLRAGFVWKTFMKSPEAQRGLLRANFTSYKR